MIQSSIVRRFQIIRLAIRLYRIFRRIQRLTAHGADSAALEALYVRAGCHIRETACHLCGAIVKAGQFLSLRQELFPDAFTRELQALQDHVPSAPYAAIRMLLALEQTQSLKDIFSHIEEEPVASASLAQVHRARLLDGETVAVKILRPGIERLVAIDLSTLGHVVRIIDRIPGLSKRMDFVTLYREFSNTLAKELNLRAEADHMNRFRQSIGDDARIVIPSVFEKYTTERTLVMTYVTGANIKDTAKLHAWGINRSMVRDALLDVYLRQILVSGFVHLDPHPGNLVVLRDGKLAILDFGMVREFSPGERSAFRTLIQYVFLRDVNGVVNSLAELGYVKPNTDLIEFASSIGPMLVQFDRTLLSGLLRHKSFRLQAKYMLLIRCLGLLKTVMTTLVPEEKDWFEVLSDHALPILLGGIKTSV